MIATHYIPAAQLHALTRRLFMAAGAPRAIADEVSQILVNSNLAGHDSHGVLRVPAYLEQIGDGRIDPRAEPALVEESATTLLLNGQKGFGHYTAAKGMELAIAKARQANVCCVNFTQINHIGRLGEYAEAAARGGCLGIITVGAGGAKLNGRTTPFGGALGVLGTNPLAVGVPTGDPVPFVLDFATSVVAEGKLQVARSKGVAVPPGCIVDKDGQPSVNPQDFYDGGRLLTFGGHKGYALSLFVCLLGGLSGQFDANGLVMGGAAMIVLNIGAFTPLADYQHNVRAFLDGIKSIPTAPGFDEVLAPGDFEQRNRQQRLAAGVPLPATILDQLHRWAAQLQVPTDESIIEAADRVRY
jgi:LDH2 family malate/lactate/ureidoglycolate dehydrogenase